MDQVKEYLKLAVQYRFWILVGVAALMPIIAYSVAAGSLNEETTTEAGKIISAEKDVKQYASGVQPNADYKSLTAERTAVLTEDVNGAWRMLYARQAPLLTWPEAVAEDFPRWGRKWPEGVDENYIAQKINDYVYVYPAYVEQVYKSFRPFDFEEGEGVVVAPPMPLLLRPATFSVAEPPTLGTVWGAQQKLWIQRTVLDVIDRVNQGAEEWAEAPVRQIDILEVANSSAVDQKTMAKAADGDPLELVPPITKEGEVAPETSTTTPSTGSGSGMSDQARMMGGAPGMSFGGMGSGGMGASSSAPDEVYILKKASPDQPYQVVPIYLSVLVEQNHIPDLLIGFKNSPMSIQVLEVQVQKPAKRVQKPTLGQPPSGFGGGMGGLMSGSGGMDSSAMMMGMGGMGGDMSGMRPGAGGPGMGYPGMGAGGDMSKMRPGAGGPGMGYPGMGMGAFPGLGGSQTKARSGVDIRQEQLRKQAEARKKAEEEGTEVEPESTLSQVSDPYYNVVEVQIWGQARFYDRPPDPTPTPGDSTAAAAEATSGDALATPPEAVPAAIAPSTDPSPAPGDAAPESATQGDTTDATPKPDAGEAPSGDEPEPDPAADPGEPDAPQAGTPPPGR